ncbi:family 43 glycosylhydrolase [Algibacter pectinivorans]|uniref:Carbohydrate binding module (Family 6) n=1 Tax=Algibacter pectinivorans TaxID=870482 RepID=A0A1I1QYM6_9FLAO|nr:family 43 glycosylhydrolase [Algibacter pectinivorans]SFD27234.1 Carbohydrate binding module (family 6) [Algibacter pectinivorans]
MLELVHLRNNYAFLLLVGICNLYAQNPIVPNQGLNDPHIHIFNDTAYVYASHDKSIDNKKFIMEDWWVLSSPDLVNWTKRSVLNPKDTYIGKDFSRCWATDAAYKNGKYYWYFSEGNEQTGVVVGDTPTGPWKDHLGKPLLNSDLTPTHEYDMAVFEDNGAHYIIFGVWDYYMAKLNDDMISLAEKPRKLIINNPKGPYNPEGNNLEKPTDDKPFMHKRNGKYYLSWGCFYAMSDNLYGPYEYKDSVIKEESFAKGYNAPTWPNGFLQGRHGSFFEWNNQWYYAYCDISQTGNRYFRDTFISYIHYKENGEMATIRVDGVGVGQYNANQSNIEAEDYFKADGLLKKEFENGFVVKTAANKSYLSFPNINGLDKYSILNMKVNAPNGGQFSIQIRKNGLDGEIINQKIVNLKPNTNTFKTIQIDLQDLKSTENFYFLVQQLDSNSLQIDSFSFSK